MNPYPTLPGFTARVAYAVAMLKALAEGRDRRYCKLMNEWASAAHDRRADDCFEAGDGKAVVWVIMRRGHADFTVWRGIEMMTGGGDGLARWKEVAGYQGPQLALGL